MLHNETALVDSQIVNHTSSHWGRSTVYVLGQRPRLPDDTEPNDYFLCSMKAGVTKECSTRFNASSSGQSLEAVCGPEHRYDMAPTIDDVAIGPNWRLIFFDFLNAMTLNTGILDWKASYPRTLTQFQLREPKLNPLLPSPAEALLSMATCTALDLVKDFPFVPFWVWSMYAVTST
jgi:hypothetical protein